MVGRHVFPCPEQGGRDGQILWLLQQRFARQTQEAMPGWLDTVHSLTKRRFKGIQEQLGEAY